MNSQFPNLPIPLTLDQLERGDLPANVRLQVANRTLYDETTGHVFYDWQDAERLTAAWRWFRLLITYPGEPAAQAAQP